MKTNKFILVAFMLVVIAVLAAACAPEAPLNEEQAAAIGLNAITALDQGDYKAYTRDFSIMMKSVVPEKDFTAYHDTANQNLGKFVSIEKIEKVPAETEGFVRWIYTCVFEKGKMQLSLVFKENGRKVEGVHFADAQ